MRGSALVIFGVFVFAVVVCQFGNAFPSSDVVAEVEQSHFDITAVAEQAKGTRVVLSTSTTYSRRKQLQNPEAPSVCDGQDCEELDDCIDFEENCVCDDKDEEVGKCYLESPCESISCATDNDCLSSINQLCKCPQGGGNCYDELLSWPDNYSSRIVLDPQTQP